MLANTPDRRITDARSVLLHAGAGDLPRQPWQHPKEPPDATALARFALWRATSQVGEGSTAELEAGLALIDSARSDLDALETALVFTARAEGLTWARIAEVMGMGSPQAAQQRYQRTSERPGQSERESSSAEPRHV